LFIIDDNFRVLQGKGKIIFHYFAFVLPFLSSPIHKNDIFTVTLDTVIKF